jgi:uncharacterized phage protein (TIGR02218 family)
MKAISLALTAHLSLSCTTVAILWKVTRQDGIILGFTNHDQDITYNDGTNTVDYKALTGYTPSANESGSDLGTDNLQATAFLDSSAISEADVRAGLYNYAAIQIRLVNYADLTMSDLKIRCGTLGQVKMQNGEFVAEVRGLTFWLTTVLGNTYGPGCRLDLGDLQCQVDLSLLAQSGSVASVTDNETFVPTAGLSPAGAGYFNYGIVTWTSGENLGYAMEIASWDGTTAKFFESMPNDIAIADTFTIEPGCNKGTDCNTKFVGVKLLDGSTTGSGGNILNKHSEDFIPGMDSILQYPNANGG